MTPIGTYIEGNGPCNYTHPIPYFDIRHNHDLAHMSTKELGLQILIDGVTGLRWINVNEGWIKGGVEQCRHFKT